MKKIYLILLGCIAISANLSAQFSIAATATNYTQDFNTLTNGTWTDNTTATGWYAKTDATASITTYGANTGSTVTAGLYAFGVAGTNPLTDRALGYAPTNAFTGGSGTGKGYLGWRLKNNTGAAITSITVTWTGEQWRKDNNASAHTLNLFYQTGTTVTNLTAGTWTTASSIFTSPIIGATAATALDGNAPANRVAGITATITVTIAAGDEIMLRWEDLNDSGNDHFMAIDDITVNAAGPAATTPTKLAITNVSPATPTANSAFSVTVQSQDATSTAANVTGNTTVNLSLIAGTGALGGTLSGVINAGTNSVVISGVTYNTAENNVTIQAADGASVLTAGQATFNVLAAASQLVMVGTPSTGYTSTNLSTFTVEARRPDNSVDNTFTSNITINKVTGPGNVAGTFTVAAVAGVATFNATQFDAAGTYTINATGGSLTSATSGNIVITNGSLSTDYFRSVASGDWSSTSTWESSPDNATWIPATIAPDFNANTITIRSGHTVAATTAITADQVEIENGAILNNTAGTFTVNNGSGDDVNIQSGGIFTLASAGGPTLNASATVNVGSNGILRLSRTGFTGAGAGVNANGFVYQNASILEYTLTSAFSASGVTYFPNANAATIPVFRTTAVIASVGGGSATVFNGVFEADGNITFVSAGTKTFRNGITGTGNIVGSGSGKFIINGATAVLGGTGLLTLPTTDGLEVGTPSTVTMTSAKSVVGNINLLASSYIELGANDLTLLGNITGGSASSYIRTNGAGMLNLQNITALKSFPVGNSTYNPVTIKQVDGFNWKVKVDDFLNVTDPIYVANVARSVQRTWTITPSSLALASGADVTFQYNDGDPAQIGALFNTALNVRIWHTSASIWSSAGPVQTPTGTAGSDRTASLTNWSSFSKFAISNDGAVLPISISYFKGARQNGVHNLNWKVNCNSTPSVTLTLERSTVANGGFAGIYTIAATAARCNQPFDHTDAQPLPGMNYYRLKMVDAFGEVSYSGVVALLNKDKGFEVTGIAPNPVTDGEFKFNVSTAQAGTMDMLITDMQGRLISRRIVSLAAGFNAVPVDASKLASGTYYIYGATADGKSKPVRFIKQ